MKKIYRLLFIFAALCIIAALVKGDGLAPLKLKFPDGDTEKIIEIKRDDWTEQAEGKILSYTIPEDISTAQVLQITNSWTSMEIYLDGKLLYTYKDEYGELGRSSHWIDIPADSGGKRIIFISNSEESFVERTLANGNYLGTADAIRHHFFMQNLPAVLLAVIELIMAGIVILVLFIIVRRRLSLGLVTQMLDLLAYILVTGIWTITDASFLQCFTSKTGFWSLVSFAAFMMMPVFMLRFTERLLTYHYKALDILIMSSLGLTALSMFLYLFRIAPVYRLLVLHQVLMVADVFVMLLVCRNEIRRYRIRRLMQIRSGILVMGVFVCAALIAYYHNLNSLYPIFFDFGFVGFIIFLTIAAVQQALYSLGRNAEMATYRDLAYKDVMTTIYNRSAFTEYQQRSEAGVQNGVCILFDINGLKNVNDTLGHQAGDDLIRRAASCIRETFEQTGTCYRIGGDEFVVILKKAGEKETRNLLELFDTRVRKSNRRLAAGKAPIEMAYGYSVAGETPRSGQEMYEEADERMYEKKREMKKAG